MNLVQAVHRRREGRADAARRHQSQAVKAKASHAVRSLVIATAMCLLPDWSSALQPRANAQPLFAGKKILIVYLSRTNNTKTVAEFIQQRVGGGTMVAVELEKPYPADYEATVQQVARENETGYLPPLKTKIDRIEQYDVVFLGFPTWGMQFTTADEEFPPSTQPERKDGNPIQHERGIRRREHVSDRQGPLCSMHGSGRLQHAGRRGKGWPISGDSRSQGRRSPKGT